MKEQTHPVRVPASLYVSFLAIALGLVTLTVSAVPQSEDDDPQRRRSPNNPLVSLADVQKNLNKTTPPQGPQNPDTAVFPLEFRTIDGTNNNAANPTWGSAGTAFARVTRVDYADGQSALAGQDRPSARAVSNAVAAQTDSTPNSERASDFLWQWGQFLDHDLDLTPEIDPAESADIEIPAGDLWFDPTGSGTVTMHLSRSLYTDDADGVRQQINTITAFIDASNVYGSDETLANALRTFDGNGTLKTSAGDLLPYNVDGLPNAAMGNPEDFFLAGDFRANEQVGLTAMHTLFVREHNYWAGRVRDVLPDLEGDRVYDYAKAIVAAEMQAITYNEFLPILLGPNAIPPYRGYRPDVDPSISNVFASAAYRFGHSMLSPQLLRLDADGEEIADGHLSLANAFFNPTAISAHGIEPLLRGLAGQRAQEIDNLIVDEVRNFLFGPPGSGGFDLASLNIQRGREHGIASFNRVRRDMGLQPYRRFGQFSDDPAVARRLRSIYDSPGDVDAWVGGLAEDHVQGGLVGPTWRAVLADQFTRLRDGDRFWYEGYLHDWMVDLVNRQTLATIIRRNTEIGQELQNNPFRVRQGN